jgi:hypothetical protein
MGKAVLRWTLLLCAVFGTTQREVEVGVGGATGPSDDMYTIKTTCSCSMNELKFKCEVPVVSKGKSVRWGNVTGTLVSVPKASSQGCKADKLKKRAEGGAPAVAMVHGGKCSLLQQARNVAAAGFAGMVVSDVDKKKQKPKRVAGEENERFPIPVVVVKDEESAGSLAALLKEKGSARVANVVFKSLMESGGSWKDSNTMYNEAKKVYLEGDTPGAIDRIYASVALDGRPYPAQYTLANYLFDLNRTAEANTILRRMLAGYRPRLPEHRTCAPPIVTAAVAAQTETPPPLPKLRVVTVATNERTELDVLKESVRKSVGRAPEGSVEHGYVYEVAGMGKQYPGLGFKITQMLQYIADVPDDDLVRCCPRTATWAAPDLPHALHDYVTT